ncbi:uncharacterized protein LOC120646918 [Panicum virgatum]|uniref:uncharacterized protein LOC120646918 n=1 Tax=Panicum virgatum TaxID=38727 RepID=UPI0019D5AD3D|nr:uncharacterized protein LOC120646918 [Panicum virgatum]
MARAIRHAAHKEHHLFLVDSGGSSGTDRSFVCDGCGCPGAGLRYRCGACDFDLHAPCATAPGAAWFFFHGQHPLVFEVAAGVGEPRRRCDICETDIRGMHYRCRPCGFDVHPICAQLPGAAISPLHPEHVVMLSVGGPECARCGADCVWRYRCGVCDVNIHPRCLLGTDQTPLNITLKKKKKTPLNIPKSN